MSEDRRRLEVICANKHSQFMEMKIENESFMYVKPYQPSTLIMPITKEGKIILVKHYRPIVDKTFWEFPGGGGEQGEALLETAKRELLEETGYSSNKFETVFYGYDRAGILNNALAFYVAHDCEKIKERNDEPFIKEVKEFSLAELRALKDNKMAWVMMAEYFILKGEQYIK